jgi:hypothetical protein
MKKVTTIKQLETLIQNGLELYYSKNLESNFEIEYIDRTTYSFNYIQCRLFGHTKKITIKLSEIYSN